MRSYCRDFVIVCEAGLPCEILEGNERKQYEQKTPLKNRILITTNNEEALPRLFAEALSRGIIPPESYLSDKLALYKSHGIII